MRIASVGIFVSLGLGFVFTIIYLYLMSNCAHVLAYIAIGLLEICFLAGIGGSVYAATQTEGNASGAWIGAGCCAAGFLLFNCMMWCYWSKL